MPRILFWNVQRKQLDGLVHALTRSHKPDVLVLIESTNRDALQLLLAPDYVECAESDRFGVFSRAQTGLVRERMSAVTNRAEFWRMQRQKGDDWLLVLVHGPDRRNVPQEATREHQFRQVMTGIRDCERRAKHRRTALFGDLNANPYDPSVLGANGLHAIGVRRVRGETDRAIRSADRVDFFYNPMWRLYGADPRGDAGAATYYHRDGYDAIEPMWHLTDQVLVRPDVADRFPEDQLRILQRAGRVSLITPEGIPDSQGASDHLPVVFALT